MADLETVFEHNGMFLQRDKDTNEKLYINEKKVVTEVKLTILQKLLAYGASIVIIVQGVMSIFQYYK